MDSTRFTAAMAALTRPGGGVAPETGETIRLHATPSGITGVDPTDAMTTQRAPSRRTLGRRPRRHRDLVHRRGFAVARDSAGALTREPGATR